jgi:type II secretory pathway predicted ATPase ExeA
MHASPPGRRPFAATPDVSAYYPATPHERALARLLGALEDGEGMVLLTGEPGTGKTLLCHVLLDRLRPGGETVFLTHTHFPDRTALLQAILFDLRLPHAGRCEQDLRLTLTEHLLETFAAGRPTTLVVDEAHHLTLDLLEELRLLGNLESSAGKALQVVLVGLPVLLDTLAAPEAATLRQRLAVRTTLEPLRHYVAADYLLHQVRICGGRPEEVFLDEAVEVLARASKGLPRLLNQAARQAQSLAREVGTEQVDVEAALEALARLGVEEDPLAGLPVLPLGGSEELAGEESEDVASPFRPNPHRTA